MKSSKSVQNYLVVTAAYWLFTLSDGALRMLVLLHFHALGYKPLAISLLFVLYELFGVATNFVGGWIGTRLGLKVTLVTGLLLQVGALCMLSALSERWALPWQVTYVIAAQGLSGIAKDFTKLSAKSAIKTLVPADASGRLFRWVALLTGSKNALKGLGFFLGGLLLAQIGFERALWSMAAGLTIAIALAGGLLPAGMGRAGKKVAWATLFSKSRSINLLSAARMFLFCARDVWFVVALPVFLSDVLGWSFAEVGCYMASWVIGYGIVQAFAPPLFRGAARERRFSRAAARWGLALACVPFAIAFALRSGVPPREVVMSGLAVFGVLFAVNSALHSYLILAYANDEHISADVGFYYMANAMGRLLGTLASGLLYQNSGLGVCLLVAGALVVIASLLAMALPEPSAQTSSP